MIEVTSADGTVIGAERIGSGPALIAVHGGTADRSRWAPVRDALAERFTCYLLDRRGRGASQREGTGDYSVDRESDDVLALLEHVGEPAYYLGHSYGAVVGISTLPRTDGIIKALLYEPPFDADGHEVVPTDFRARYAALIEQERRDDALDLFYREVIGIDPTPLHDLPVWQARKAAAPTLVREGEAAATYVPDRDALAGVTTPVLVLLGDRSPAPFAAAARLTADAIPSATLIEAPGQGHVMIDADPAGFVSLVAGFFLD